MTECTPCNVDGKYSISDNASFCLTAKAGYKPTSDRKGEEQCSAGTYSTGAAEDCEQCASGETSGEGAAGCSTCATCAAGRYLINTCTPFSETECGECLAGTASIGGSVTECESCNEDGKYSNTNLASVCKTASAGHKPSVDHTSIETCPKNTFSIGASNDCTPCLDGGHSRPGSSACEKCSTGKYFHETDNSCESCPLGKFTATGESDITNCKDCDPGFISNDPEGSGFCSPCPAGHYANPSQTACLPCSPGCISGIASTFCDACDKGKFAFGEKNTFCTYCDEVLKGSDTITTGATSDKDCKCGAGEYKSDSSSSCELVMEGVDQNATEFGMTLQTLYLKPGHWRVTENSTVIYKCFNEDLCLGGSNLTSACVEGSTGPYCEVCEEGFAKSQGVCVECSGNSKLTVIVGTLGTLPRCVLCCLFPGR